MADAASKGETLRALLSAFRTCLIRPRERAEKIACNDLDDYRSAFDDDEGLAQSAFNDDVDQAEEALEWRAVAVGDLVGGAMSDYAKANSALDDPWTAWRLELSAEPGGVLVRRLSEEEFFCSRVAYHIHADLNIRRPASVPTDGDLEDIQGYLETEPARTWQEWLEILGPPQEEARLSPVMAAANHDLTGQQTQPDSEVAKKIAELADMVAAFQMPMIDGMERLVAQVAAPNRFRAEESLQEELGTEVYKSLSDSARAAALEAERRFRDPETVDWNSVISELAKAFEL
jgi:hypothetical protein